MCPLFLPLSAQKKRGQNPRKNGRKRRVKTREKTPRFKPILTDSNRNRRQVKKLQLELPGFKRPAHGQNLVADTAERILTDLDKQGLLTGVHAINAQLIMQLATAAGNQLAYGKPTIAAVTAVKQIAELLATLPTEAASDPAAQLMNALEEAAKRE